MSSRRKKVPVVILTKEDLERLEQKELEKTRIQGSIQKARDEVASGKRLINLGSILHIICSVGFSRETQVACSTCKDLWSDEEHLAQIANKTYSFNGRPTNRISLCIGARTIRGYKQRQYYSNKQDDYGDAARDALVADRLQKLLAAGASGKGTSLLRFAISQGLTETVRLLSAQPGLKINTYDSRPPLVMAVTALQSPIPPYTVQTNLDIVRILLDVADIDVNALDETDGSSALSVACEQFTQTRSTNPALVQLLLQAPEIDINWGNPAPLCHSVGASNRIVFELLTSSPEIDPNATGSEERPLVKAILRRDGRIIDVLLGLPNININMSDTSNAANLTPLIAACKNLDLPRVKQLCARAEIDVNAATVCGNSKYNATALIKICELFSPRSECQAILQFLLEQKGININAQCNQSEKSALSAAAGARDKGAFIILLQQPGIVVGANVLFEICQDDCTAKEGLVEVCKALLAVPELFPVGGRSRALADAVKLSCYLGLGDTLSLLLPLPDVLIRREDIAAVFKNGNQILATMLMQGDGFAAGFGGTSFLVACVCESKRVYLTRGQEHEYAIKPTAGHVGILKMLMNFYDFDLEAAYVHVERACEHGHENIVAAFLTHAEFDVNHVRAEDGASLVMIAADNKNLEVVRELVAVPGIDLNLNDYEGKRALHYATLGAQGGSALFFFFLLSHGAYQEDAPDGRSRSGRTLKVLHRS